MTTKSTSRREFLKNSGILGAGLMVGFTLGKKDLFRPDQTSKSWEPNPFISIDRSGRVTLVNPNPDMGQGSRQAIPTLLAEELEVSIDNISIIQSDGNNKYGVQISGGSGSVRRAWEPLRKAGAAAREMLIKAAASKWKIGVGECFARDGEVFNKTNNASFSYGELVDLAATFEVPQNPALKKTSEFKLIGKPGKHPDMEAKLTGKAVYGIDVEIPGMVVAAILHAPSILAKVTSIDDTETRKVPGVLDVVQCERPMPHRTTEAVAVIATHFWAALQGRKSVAVTWEEQLEDTDSAAYFARLHQALPEPGLTHVDENNFDAYYLASSRTLEAVYETPFLAHAPMEPPNATAQVNADGTVEIWAPVQAPDWARDDIAKYLNIVPEKIKVNVTLSGGSFGRKAYHDYLLEACHLSRKLKKPVQVIWSREDDIAQGPYRPAFVSRFRGVVRDSKITGLHHHALGESIDIQVFGRDTAGVADPVLCGEMAIKYKLESSRISYNRIPTDIPIVWWRSVYASNFGFGQESFIDELAHKANIDPLKARLDILEDERFIKVLHTLADKSGYHNPTPADTARGIAIWESFGSISAACVTVRKAGAEIKIDHVTSVIDCGIYVNPDMVRAQTEGNILMGLGAAIKGGITFRDGRCEQTNFHQYHILRANEIPTMEVHIMENDHPPGGVGEPGLPPVAGALGNAIFNLSGIRIRKLPVDLKTFYRP